MGVKKYYAVKQGRNPGIYHTWDECKKQVHGFSGASYKGFESLEAAREFMEPGQKDSEAEFDTENKDTVTAYVDGSYDKVKKEFSYGVVLFYNNEELHFSEKFNTADLVEMRNVAGEIKGAERAMQYCIDNSVNAIKLHYDYEGIEKWCTGEWKTNKTGTKAYKQFYDSICKQLKVEFVKVRAHTGVKYNELADQLAKRALFD